MIKGQMTGWRFQTGKELERARNWLVERGLLAHIDYEKMEVVVSGTVNGKWVTDSNGDLIRIDKMKTSFQDDDLTNNTYKEREIIDGE